MDNVGRNDQGYRVGQSHHNAKFSDHDVELIRQLNEAGLSYREIVDRFDHEIAESTVRDICTYRRRAQIPTRWSTAK